MEDGGGKGRREERQEKERARKEGRERIRKNGYGGSIPLVY